MQGERLKEFSGNISAVKESMVTLTDLEQVGVLHELIDDTPYKTKNYMKYLHDEYYIVHNKGDIIVRSKKFYSLAPNKEGTSSDLFSLIKNRSSARDYMNRSVPFERFSNIIHYSFGVKSIGKGVYDQKSFPFKYINSQGGLNYLDLYVFIMDVEGIEPGLYYYDFINDRLCQMDYGNTRSAIKERYK